MSALHSETEKTVCPECKTDNIRTHVYTPDEGSCVGLDVFVIQCNECGQTFERPPETDNTVEINHGTIRTVSRNGDDLYGAGDAVIHVEFGKTRFAGEISIEAKNTVDVRKAIDRIRKALNTEFHE